MQIDERESNDFEPQRESTYSRYACWSVDETHEENTWNNPNIMLAKENICV